MSARDPRAISEGLTDDDLKRMSDDELDELAHDLARERESATDRTWTRYDLTTQPDGTLVGMASTNDNLDSGFPSAYADWQVGFPTVGEAMKRSRGVGATVYLDGRELDRVGVPIERRKGPANRRHLQGYRP